MVVKYNLIQKPNPRAADEPKKYYANLKRGEVLTLKKISQRLSQITNTSEAVIWTALRSFFPYVIQELQDGNVIKIEDFGSFRFQISSSGAESPEEFSHRKHIKRKSILFVLENETKAILQNTKFERINDKKNIEITDSKLDFDTTSSEFLSTITE